MSKTPSCHRSFKPENSLIRKLFLFPDYRKNQYLFEIVSKLFLKQGKSVILFLKINLSQTISMEGSRQALSVDMLIERGIFEVNIFTRLPCFFIIKQVWDKKGVCFWCD